MNKIEQLRENPWAFLKFFAKIGLLQRLPDVIYLKLLFRASFGEKLNLKKPQTINEKLQWLKLHDHNPQYTQMVDKYLVREYIEHTVGKEYLIPLLGVWDNPDDIDFDALPKQFVLKCNHDSGSIVICKDKDNFDIRATKDYLKKRLKMNYYKAGREWPYKSVQPKIICEKYMEDESGTELKDYKVFNFNGEPKIIEVDFNRFVKHKRNLYTTDWTLIDGMIKYPSDPNIVIPKPDKLNEMLKLSRKLAVGIPFVRTDFYSINDKLYFGEITFFHESGTGKFEPKELGMQFGEWLRLPDID